MEAPLPTYLGNFSLDEFIAITNNTQIIVTPVSMMMHIALALKKQIMLIMDMMVDVVVKNLIIIQVLWLELLVK